MKYIKNLIFCLVCMIAAGMAMTSCKDECEPSDYFTQKPNIGTEDDMSIDIDESRPTRATLTLNINNSNYASGTVYYWAENQTLKSHSSISSGSYHPTVTLTGLKTNTRYYVQYILYDRGGNSVESSIHTFFTGKYQLSLKAKVDTTRQTTVNFSYDYNFEYSGSRKIYYWKKGQTKNTNNYTTYSYLEKLEQATTYCAQCEMTVSANSEKITSNVVEFTTGTYKAVITSVNVAASQTVAYVDFKTNFKTNGTVYYYYWKDKQTDKSKSTSSKLSNLSPNSKYNVQCEAYSYGDNVKVTTNVYTFTTSDAPHYLSLYLIEYLSKSSAATFFNNTVYTQSSVTSSYWSNICQITNEEPLDVYVVQPYSSSYGTDYKNLTVPSQTVYRYGHTTASYSHYEQEVVMNTVPMTSVSVKLVASNSTSKNVTASNVQLRNSSSSSHYPVAKNAKLNLTTGKLTSPSGSTSYTQYAGLSMQKKGNTKTVTFNNLIPTSYPTEAELYIDFSGDNNAYPVTVPLAGKSSWEAGKAYEYEVGVTYTSKGVSLSINNVTVEEWTSKNGSITIYE